MEDRIVEWVWPGQSFADELPYSDGWFDALQRRKAEQHQSISRKLRESEALKDPFRAFRDADLVMEMLKRGYAVMKLPEDGGPPEVLR